MKIKTYSEMIRYPTFVERYHYLKIGGALGAATFGSSRYINQGFYRSSLWKDTRREIILRDNGCDLADPDRQIYDRLVVHHLNPIDEDDLLSHSDFLLDPEFLVCTTFNTHNAIHFGDETLLPILPITRRPNDTSPWR